MPKLQFLRLSVERINQISYNCPDPAWSKNFMMKTLEYLIKATKVKLQDLFMRRMFSAGIPTPHAKKSANSIMLPYKSSLFNSLTHKRAWEAKIMAGSMMDAQKATEEAFWRAGSALKDLKLHLRHSRHYAYNYSSFMAQVRNERELLWEATKKRHNRSFTHRSEAQRPGTAPGPGPVVQPGAQP